MRALQWHSFGLVATITLVQLAAVGEAATGPKDECLYPFSPNAKRSRKYFLAVGVLVRAEAPWVVEWANHYLSEGVEHIYMIDQESSINGLGATARALRDAIGSERVTFLDPPELASAEMSAKYVMKEEHKHITHLSIANLPNMASSYRLLAKRAAEQATYLLLLDSDEFMYASEPNATVASVLRDIVRSYPDTAEVGVEWELYGSGGHVMMPKCVVSSMTWRRPVDAITTRVMKSILRLDALKTGGTPGVHRTAREELCPGWSMRSADGALQVPIKGELHKAERIKGRPLLRLNHYQYRSRDFTFRVKSCRGLALSGRSGDSLHAAETMRSFVEQDHAASVCDPSLARRQALAQRAQSAQPAKKGVLGLPALACPPPAAIAAAVGAEPELAFGDWGGGRPARHFTATTTGAEAAGFVDVGPGCGVREPDPGSDMARVVNGEYGGLRRFGSCEPSLPPVHLKQPPRPKVQPQPPRPKAQPQPPHPKATPKETQHGK